VRHPDIIGMDHENLVFGAVTHSFGRRAGCGEGPIGLGEHRDREQAEQQECLGKKSGHLYILLKIAK
jgi:hypothetical protein